MQDDFIEMMEATPKLKSKKCKLISLFLKLALQTTTYITALVAWYMYDYFIGGAIFLLTFIVMGIVRSKIRNSVIPSAQLEHIYSDKAIADWYTAKEICNDALEQSLEVI